VKHHSNLDLIKSLALIINEGSVLHAFQNITNDHLIIKQSATQGYSINDPGIALQSRALARLSMLIEYSIDDHPQLGNDDNSMFQHQSFEYDVRNVLILDEAQRSPSDENVLAALKHTSSHEFKHLTRAFQCNGWIPAEVPENGPSAVNPLEADCALALRGYSQGIAHASNCSNSPQGESLVVWTRMLQVAGDEHAVSFY